MNRTALFLIESDPRTSPRCAEAARIATGVSAWQQLKVLVCLREAAVLVLGDALEALPGIEPIQQHLRDFIEAGGTLLVQFGDGDGSDLRTSRLAATSIDDADLAACCAAATWMLRF